MTHAETSVASGRVSSSLKKRVDEKIKRRGLSPNDIIVSAYAYIDTHDDIPWIESKDEAARTDLFGEFCDLIDSVPLGTPLDAMMPEDLKRELQNRD